MEAIKLVEKAITNSAGGEIYIPKLKSFYIRDLIHAITGKKNHFKIVGIRPGEKIHEELINLSEIKNTIEHNDHYVILSNFSEKQILNYCNKKKYKKVASNFIYNSGDNKKFMSLKELKTLLQEKNIRSDK